ncbi:hypothetical protein [Janthinobacterium sp.]|uniref:hypothetical protein n=1 Tax=Janthinobacterium sp. TaxID=1871054 RepID=UPI00293D253C|nr:hypothetical protein [Janthinobacterium sp.]
MTALAALGYLLVCAYLATHVLRLATRKGGDSDTLTRPLVWTSGFFLAFFLGFHLLGYLNLATGKHIVNASNALLILAPCAAAAFFWGRRAGSLHAPRPWGIRRARRFGLCLAGLTALTFALAAVMLICGFPQGYEVTAYHLPGAVGILQTQSLKAWDGNFPHTFPANASIFYAFFLAFLPEKLVSAANLLLLLPLVLGVTALSRRAGADRGAALLAACGVLTVPMVAFSAVELGADIGGIAFIAMAMFLALTRALPRRAGAALAGVCAGLAFGFKSLHLISIAFLALLFLTQGGQTRRWRLGLRLCATFLAGVALTAGYWLVRNSLDFGNPLYPVGLPVVGKLLGWSVAPDVDFAQRHATQFEWVGAPLQWLWYPWVEPQALGQNFKHSSGLGAFFAAGVPLAALAVAGAAVKQGVARHRLRLTLLLAAAFIVATWWLLDDRQPRYVLAALVYCVPLVAWLLTQAERRWRPAMNAVFGLCIAAMLMVFLSKQALLFGDRIVMAGYTTRALFYEYPREIDALPAGATILNLADRSWHYPLAGAGLANRVISMPEGRRALGLAPGLAPPRAVILRAAPLLALGVTHVFVAGAALSADSCVSVREVGRMDRNPANAVPLGAPRLLLALRYASPAPGAVCRVPLAASATVAAVAPPTPPALQHQQAR